MEKTPQNKSNHRRTDPAYHFFLLPAVLLFLVWSVIHLVRHPGHVPMVFVGLAIILMVMSVKLRSYPVKVQDRVIRLEEQLRLSRLLPEALRVRISELTESQLIALRFASDAEVPGLVERALNERLDRKQIKAAIQNWRPDYWRV
ncbi:MAG: hypothetical protein JO097_11640 [Acidobacteriaceae bacterium]|nr:hypothetical protein [Acidobacteriaceae bacterium]